MDSSSAQSHHQEMGSQTLESMLISTKPQQEKKPRPADMQSLKCPRCDSTNTKFCYYNNYSLSQPRYFCKSCRRYWTKGGTLRNVPVGGGCRKNKRSSSSTSSSSSSKRTQDQPLTTLPTPIPSLNPYDSNDLTLAIARLQNMAHPVWADPNMAHHGDGLAHFGAHGGSSGLFDAVRAGFVETPTSGNGIQNFYYGNVEIENGGMGMSSGSEGMGIPFEDFRGNAASTTAASKAVTAVKQEMCGGRDGDGRVSWGFPWQNIGGDGGAAADFDSGRVNWNGIGSANWHGLLNSPLM